MKNNIYIETDENFRVTKIHRMPFDPNNGMGYTKEELDKKGFFVEEVPAPINKTGQRAIAMYNPDNKSIYYEYIGVPMSDKERVELLENAMNSFIHLNQNAIFGIGTPYTMMRTSLAVVAEEPQEDPNLESIGKYLAYQIMCGKLDLLQTITNYPKCEATIKSVLKDNGIQV